MHGCPYDGHKLAKKKVHAWVNYDKFIDQLRKNIPPVIRERIAELQKKLAKNQTLFNERMVPLNKRLEELQAAYDEYCKYELPRDVEKLKKRAVRPYVGGVIGGAIGFAILVFALFKWLLPQWIFFIKNGEIFLALIFIVGFIVLFAICLGKPVVDFLKAKRNAESRSQMFADELTSKWRDINGLNKAIYDINTEKNKYNNIRNDFELRIDSAERALVGSDEDLLKFYHMDNETKKVYLEEIYDEPEGEW